MSSIGRTAANLARDVSLDNADLVGDQINNLLQVVDVAGAPGLPAIDGSQLTGIAAGGSDTTINRIDEIAAAGQTAFNVPSDSVPWVTMNGINLSHPTEFTFADGVVTLLAPLAEGDQLVGLGWVSTAGAGGGAAGGGTTTVATFQGTYGAEDQILGTSFGARSDYGYDVDVSSDGALVIVGAPSGQRAYLHEYNVSTGKYLESPTQTFIEPPVSGGTYSQFGGGVSFSGDKKTLVIADVFEEGTGVSFIYRRNETTNVYECDDGTGTAERLITPEGTTNGTYGNFGCQSAFANNDQLLAVTSAEHNSPISLTDTGGGVWLYDKQPDGSYAFNGTALETASPEPRSLFGWAMDITEDGSVIAVGSMWRASKAGMVSIFTKQPDNSWSEFIMANPDGTSAAEFGSALSFTDDGSVMYVGARAIRTVYVYDCDHANNTYVIRQTIDAAIGTNPSNWGDRGVANSKDGNVVAIGSTGERSVYIFKG